MRHPPGARFWSDSGLDIGIFGLENYDDSPHDYLCAVGCAGASYSVDRPNLAIVSGRGHGHIYYRRCLRPAGTQALHCFDLNYPEGMKGLGPVIERMGRSLR